MMADKTIPLCKDCKYFSLIHGSWSCDRPVPLVEPDLVRGAETRRLLARPQRERRKRCFFEFDNARCGPEGMYFEAIEPPEFAPPVCGSRASIPLKSTPRFRALFDESIAEQNQRNAEEQLAANKPGGDLAYGKAEGTIERYQRYAQEMQQIRKDEWED